MKIEWEAPAPAATGSRHHNTIFFATLKKQRMKWAILKRKFRSSSTTFKAMHPGFEFAVRSEADGSRTCYARYVGGTRGKRGKKAKK